MTTALLILWVFRAYIAIGAIVAIGFALRGAQRVDPATRNATWAFRLIILPGAMALWPLVLRMWIGAGSQGART